MRVKCSSGTSFESLERISAPEEQIPIGWKPLSSSVAFSSFNKGKIAMFYSYFCFESRFQAIFAKIHQKMDCKARKTFKDTLGVPLKCSYHRYDTPYSHRKHKIEIKDFSKNHFDKLIFKLFSLLKIGTKEKVLSDISARSYWIA